MTAVTVIWPVVNRKLPYFDGRLRPSYGSFVNSKSEPQYIDLMIPFLFRTSAVLPLHLLTTTTHTTLRALLQVLPHSFHLCDLHDHREHTEVDGFCVCESIQEFLVLTCKHICWLRHVCIFVRLTRIGLDIILAVGLKHYVY